MNQLSHILKIGRERKGWTQAEVELHTGIARKTYSTYESGSREPDFITLIGLVKTLGISVEFFELFAVEQNADRSNSVVQPVVRKEDLLKISAGLLELVSFVDKISGNPTPANPSELGTGILELYKDIKGEKRKPGKAK